VSKHAADYVAGNEVIYIGRVAIDGGEVKREAIYLACA
jgi:hypothetical protein